MPSPSPTQFFYAGEFRHFIDDKNRITIPARWRRDQGEEFILLPEANHQFLLVMSPASLVSKQSQLRTIYECIAF
jgi:DNA-binding transcriptional regulator/RsmH inhibitor MraZ